MVHLWAVLGGAFASRGKLETRGIRVDWQTFIVQLVGALAWPVTVLIIFLILRRQLLALIPMLTRLRFRDLELDFGRRVQELANEARQQLAPLNGAQEQDRMRENWLELAQISPRAVVLEAWLQLEKAAIEAARQNGLDLKSAELKTPLILGQALEDASILNGDTAGIYHQLRNLRNAAAHASDFAFTSESAIEYADLATRLTSYLQNPAKSTP
jgi:hypothetical protein